MEQIRTAVPEQESSFHPRPAAATITDLMQLPPTTVQQHDHAAAAAYLMKHAGTTALMVVDARAGQPTGIITAADIARAIADGKDVNDVWVDAVMTTRPAIIATTNIRDAAEMMTIALDGPVFCRQNVLFWLVRGAGQAGGRQCSFDLVVRAVTARPRIRPQP